MYSSKTSTDILEELITVLDIFRIHLKTAKDHLKHFDLSELVLKIENTFIKIVVYNIKSVETRIDFQDTRDWLVMEK